MRSDGVPWSNARAVRWLVDTHVQRYPLLEAQDVYKLLYQAVLGPEHAVHGAHEFGGRLRAECASLTAEHADLLWESLRPDGGLVRVHLRPYLATQRDVDALAKACLRTAEHKWGTVAELEAAWAALASLAERGTWPGLRASDVALLTERLKSDRYPALHHSASYRRAYSPAYRVVGGHELRELLAMNEEVREK